MPIARSILVLLLTALPLQAGVHYSGEKFAELPSKWSGFLVDHRALRAAGIEKPKDAPQTPLRELYLSEAAKLEKKPEPSADDLADLGALYLRLGKTDKTLATLRAASAKHPSHFRIASNLGTAWQLSGELEQAALALDDAVRLAPAKLKPFEEAHLKLVRLRLKERKANAKPDSPDALFDEPLPENAVSIVQYLALALPADGRLLWQLGELAHSHGDPRTAAAILDGCVTEFGMSAPLLREHRQAYRAEAEAMLKKPAAEQHKNTFVPKSARPLVPRFDATKLPPVSPDRSNPLPWALLAGTLIEPKVKPVFPDHLKKLNGHTVVMYGFMQPLADAKELTGFMLTEYPIGCWFCESPEPTALVNVELMRGSTTEHKRGLVKVTGTLQLNDDNPEDFLFRIKDARLADPE
jgi:hypothetical protein